jgi:hypothetical protein
MLARAIASAAKTSMRATGTRCGLAVSIVTASACPRHRAVARSSGRLIAADRERPADRVVAMSVLREGGGMCARHVESWA